MSLFPPPFLSTTSTKLIGPKKQNKVAAHSFYSSHSPFVLVCRKKNLVFGVYCGVLHRSARNASNGHVQLLLHAELALGLFDFGQLVLELLLALLAGLRVVSHGDAA